MAVAGLQTKLIIITIRFDSDFAIFYIVQLLMIFLMIEITPLTENSCEKQSNMKNTVICMNSEFTV